MVSDAIAEALEDSGFYRRAARRWLEVFDLRREEAERAWVAQRRDKCLSLAGCPAEAKAQRRRDYRTMQRYAA